MLLSCFTEPAYEKILHSISENEEKYQTPSDWISEFFGEEEYFKTSKTVDVMYFKPHYEEGKKSDELKSEEDLINTRNMYDAFKKLTPLQASNKYMWTYLCHADLEYQKYIHNRWMTKERDNTIKTRYFVTDKRDSLFENALARLWWYGYLTYDENRSNPYALTSILLMNQTICTDFIDTKNSMNPTRAKGVLAALQEYSENVGKSGLTNKFRELNKHLNRIAAVTNFDFLKPEDITKICLDFLWAKQ